MYTLEGEMGKENLSLWDKVKTPDPAFVKEFKRSGGFVGSSTSAQYSICKATEIWGENGTGWGFEIVNEQFIEGAPMLFKEQNIGKEVIHIAKGYVWYIDENGDKKKTSTHYGQTTFVGTNKYGPFTDEEAPKKTITDMMAKCLSLLGFSADIHMGMWDDDKYVNNVRLSYVKDKAKELCETWVDRADRNSDTIDDLADWYDDNRQEISSLPEAVRDDVNKYVCSLKNAMIDESERTKKQPK